MNRPLTKDQKDLMILLEELLGDLKTDIDSIIEVSQNNRTVEGWGATKQQINRIKGQLQIVTNAMTRMDLEE